MKFKVKKYNANNPILKKLIKYFWIINFNNQNINHKYLPVTNIDLVINLDSLVKYVTKHYEITISNTLYFNGITSTYKWSIQKNVLNLIGISFFPTGFYPFIKIPLSEFKNNTILLDQINQKITYEVVDRIQACKKTEEKLLILENILLKLLDHNQIIDNKLLRIINEFKNTTSTIEEFCANYGIHKRTLERIFNKYIGTSPKTFSKITRFLKIIKQIENNKYTSLTDLGYDNNYYDQMHFIKDFKLITGSTPTDYINQKSSLRDILIF